MKKITNITNGSFLESRFDFHSGYKILFGYPRRYLFCRKFDGEILPTILIYTI